MSKQRESFTTYLAAWSIGAAMLAGSVGFVYVVMMCR